jgi:predicted O-methyltransferase YrrM
MDRIYNEAYQGIGSMSMINTRKEQGKFNAPIPITLDEIALLGSQLTISETEAVMVNAASHTGGLLTTPEALTLHRICERLPDGARILEIGSYLGASTTAIGHAILGREIALYCLDCWHDYQTQGFFEHTLVGSTATDGDIFSKFQASTRFLGTQLRILKGTTEQFKDFLPTGFFDLIFIDAAHDYENVCNDLLISMKSLVPGGVLLGHDYHSDGHGVVAAVNQIIYESQDIVIKGTVPGTSIWYALVSNPTQDLARIKNIVTRK